MRPANPALGFLLEKIWCCRRLPVRSHFLLRRRLLSSWFLSSPVYSADLEFLGSKELGRSRRFPSLMAPILLDIPFEIAGISLEDRGWPS
ncbi:hypothetical protein Nepgr_002989 [Nepenthes gracilis]|uniref:Uncharacterized protein n=1 Tax=Nepenthes gracilis TaxID=150966 RepID=A0AAD3RYP0_NEPGR|nr:hypothetical protein Nepgr_002989 [Nepenthes gracilis]